MAGLIAEPAEINTIITMLGCLCATVQAATGYYAGYKKKKVGLLKTLLLQARKGRLHRLKG